MRYVLLSLLCLVVMPVPAMADPVPRWGVDLDRAARAPRASDPRVRVNPVRPRPQARPLQEPYLKAAPPYRPPRYGPPPKAIDRIPGT